MTITALVVPARFEVRVQTHVRVVPRFSHEPVVPDESVPLLSVANTSNPLATPDTSHVPWFSGDPFAKVWIAPPEVSWNPAEESAGDSAEASAVRSNTFTAVAGVADAPRKLRMLMVPLVGTPAFAAVLGT